MIKKFWRKVRNSEAVVQPAQRPLNPKLLLTEACVEGLRTSIDREARNGHEGIAYLLGHTNGAVTLAVASFRPQAETTPGSFFVTPQAMAAVVRAAVNLHLQVVAQVHTHPRGAFHSDGDVEGAKIRYPGYSSIVLPNYGRDLPRLEGAAVYMFTIDKEWVELRVKDVTVIPEYCDA